MLLQSQTKSQLVKVDQKIIGGETVQAVNARGLHEALEVKRDFSHWIKDQFERGMFEKDRDYAVYVLKDVNTANITSGGRPSIEYALSLDCAKHICMMSGTEKGKVGRAA